MLLVNDNVMQYLSNTQDHNQLTSWCDTGEGLEIDPDVNYF